MDRILFVNLEGTMAGAETSLALTAQSLQPWFDLAVACPLPSPLAKALAARTLKVHGLPDPPAVSHLSPRCCPYWTRTVYRLLQLTRAIKPSLIHANNLCSGLASLPAVWATGTRLVLHVRDLANPQWASRLCGRFCQRVIAVSGAVRDKLTQCGVPPGKITVLHNAVEDCSTEPPGAGGGNGLGEREERVFTFAHVGQFVPWKNHFLFLDAAAGAASELPGCRFVFVGDDVFGRDSHYRRQLLHHIERSPVSDRIVRMGWQDDMTKIWTSIDCLVHTADREPFGRVIIEAMAHGVPVIAVGCCGPAEIIRHGENGILVPPGDVPRLSQAMCAVAGDRRLARRLAAAGREHVRCHFTTAQMIPRLLQVYREVLAE